MQDEIAPARSNDVRWKPQIRVRRSKYGVLVCTERDEQRHTTEGPELHLWEPELDTEMLNQQDVPEHWRVSKDILPGDFVQQFWIENKGKKQTGASSTM
jgi:hypothetical protein